MARQLQSLGEIDFEIILRDRKSPLKIQAPNVTVGKNAKSDFVVRLDVHSAQVLKHLRRGDALFTRILPVGTIQRPLPSLSFQYCEAVLKALPLLSLGNREGLCC
jgi:hypothetical protein